MEQNNKFALWLENELVKINQKLGFADNAMTNMEIFLIGNNNVLSYLKLIHRKRIIIPLLAHVPNLSVEELICIVFKELMHVTSFSLQNSDICREQNVELFADKHKYNSVVYFTMLKFYYPDALNSVMGKQLEKLIYSF